MQLKTYRAARSDAEWSHINTGCMPPICDTYSGTGSTCPVGCIFDDLGSANDNNGDTCVAPDCMKLFDGSAASCIAGCEYVPDMVTDAPLDCAAFAAGNASFGLGVENCESAWAIGLSAKGKWVNAYQVCEVSCGSHGSFPRGCDMPMKDYTIPGKAWTAIGFVFLFLVRQFWLWRSKAPAAESG